jgi:hypothetical protein
MREIMIMTIQLMKMAVRVKIDKITSWKIYLHIISTVKIQKRITLTLLALKGN